MAGAQRFPGRRIDSGAGNAPSGAELSRPTIVARVQPRTSKGISDLLLPQPSSSSALAVPLRTAAQRCESAARARRAGTKPAGAAAVVRGGGLAR